jgi:hypothetical protein
MQSKNTQYITCEGKIKCINRGCNFQSYFPSLSQDGFCSDCEFKLFPERYTECMICKKINYGTSICYICREETKKMFLNIFSIINFIKIDTIIENILIKCELLKLPQIGILNNEKCKLLNTDPWKGFYKGNMEWVIPDFSKWNINIDDITNENSETVIIRELEKNGVFIYENIQVGTPKR